MRFKFLTVLAALSLVAACSSDGDESADAGSSGETQQAAAPAPAPAPAPTPAPSGPAAGSEAHFVVTAGDRVFFAYDSSELSAAAQATLDLQAQWLRSFPSATIRVEGHCDERGTREYNLALGERRANSVREYLISQGVNAGRIETISYGKERPAVAGANETAWSQNRRSVTDIVSGAAS